MLYDWQSEPAESDDGFVNTPKDNVRLRKAPPWCVHTVWCDESGATVNELLDANQEHFVYASVAVEPRDAEEIRHKIVRENTLQGLELKGKNLCGHTKGRQAIHQLIELVSDRAHLVVHHKKYALAAKFFEYVFEPVLAEKNWLFYKIGFHRFISNLLFVWAMSQNRSADQILSDFARAPPSTASSSVTPLGWSSTAARVWNPSSPLPMRPVSSFPCFRGRAIIVFRYSPFVRLPLDSRPQEGELSTGWRVIQ